MPIREVWDALTEDLPEGAKHRLIVLLIAILLVFHVSWACGWLPGVSGFAMAADTEKVSKEVQELRDAMKASNDELRELLKDGLVDLKRSQLEGRISALHVLRCAADDPVLRQEYANQIQRLQAEYWRLTTGGRYPLEECPRTVE